MSSRACSSGLPAAAPRRPSGRRSTLPAPRQALLPVALRLELAAVVAPAAPVHLAGGHVRRPVPAQVVAVDPRHPFAQPEQVHLHGLLAGGSLERRLVPGEGAVHRDGAVEAVPFVAGLVEVDLPVLAGQPSLVRPRAVGEINGGVVGGVDKLHRTSDDASGHQLEQRNPTRLARARAAEHHRLPPAISSCSLPRRNVLSTLLSTSTVLLFGPKQITLADTTGGAFREYIDTFDGYSFLYPKSWIQVRGAGADIFFRDPVLLDVNMSVDISSPSSSKYETVEDLGPPEKAAEGVLKQYLTEFMSTRLGVRRESNVLSASSKVADDGKLYYEVEVNIKSYASNNELAVMPKDRVQRLEWDRRYLTVLGVENNRLYALRLQSPERVFSEEEGDLRRVMDSFRVNKTDL